MTILKLLLKEKVGINMIENICRCCGNEELKTVINLGNSPLANNLLDSITQTVEMYPLEVLYCNKCHYCQLSYTVPSNKLFDTYLYTSSTTKSFQDHFYEAANKYIHRFKLDKNSIVLDIGCNDGIGLIPFKEKNIKTFGVDPASNIVLIAKNKGLDVVQGYFDENLAENILNKIGKVDIITASNVFAHSPNIDSITNGAFKLLKDNGMFIIEVQYICDTVKDLTFDNIYHEHVSYWSVTSLYNFFKNRGFSIVDVEHIPTHGGSIRVYVQQNSTSISPSVLNFLKKEKNDGITNYQFYKSFGDRINNIKKNVNTNISKLKIDGYKLVGYGAPAKATTALNFYNIDNTIIEYIVEDNQLKHKKIVPGVNIPIHPKEEINNNKPDIIVTFAWNFFEEIKKNNPQFEKNNIKLMNIKELEQTPDTYNLYLL